MTFKEILDITKNFIDETDIDEQIDIIIKSAVNEAYSNLCVIDKRVVNAFIPIINGLATLPQDIISIVKIEPELTSKDKIIGNSIVTNQSGMFTILYSYSREPLLLDNDEPDLNNSLIPCLYNYAAYKYFLHRKKSEPAQMFLNTYNSIISSFMSTSDSVVEHVIDVYSGDYNE